MDELKLMNNGFGPPTVRKLYMIMDLKHNLASKVSVKKSQNVFF